MTFLPGIGYSPTASQDINGDSYSNSYASGVIRQPVWSASDASRMRVCRPEIVWIPYGPGLVTYTNTVAIAIANGNYIDTVPVTGVFDANPTNSLGNTITGWGANCGFGSPVGTDNFTRNMMFVAIHPDDERQFHLHNGTNSSVSNTTNKDCTQHLLFGVTGYELGMTPWSDWAFEQSRTMDNLQTPNVYALMYGWLSGTGDPTTGTTSWRVMSREKIIEENGMANTHDVIWLPVDTTTGCWKLSLLDDNFDDWPEPPKFVLPRGYMNVSEYGQGYYRMSFNFGLNYLDSAKNFNNSPPRTAFTIGESQSGRIDFHAKFPGDPLNQEPMIRFVSYLRPTPLKQNTTGSFVTPLAVHQGWVLTISESNGYTRAVYDNKVLTGHSLSFLTSDTIFMEMGVGATNDLDARRLKLPTATLENIVGFTKPWDTDPGVAGMASPDFDIAVHTKDQLEWQATINMRDGYGRGTFLAESVSQNRHIFYAELGFIGRSLSFRGDNPYVTRTRGAYRETGA
jgi:hypothetical protein